MQYNTVNIVNAQKTFSVTLIDNDDTYSRGVTKSVFMISIINSVIDFKYRTIGYQRGQYENNKYRLF